jgi:hypothetical protein
MPPDRLQLSVFAAGAGAAVARRTVEWAVDAVFAVGAALARVADGTAFAFAAACDRLGCGLADAEAAGRPAVAADRIMVDPPESTPTPTWLALLWPGSAMSAEMPDACGWPLPATRP